MGVMSEAAALLQEARRLLSEAPMREAILLALAKEHDQHHHVCPTCARARGRSPVIPQECLPFE